MKLSTDMVGTLLFTAVATAAFVWMAQRPAVDGNAMILGLPISAAVVEEKTEEKIPKGSTPVAEREPTQAEDPATMPAVTAEPAPAEIEIKAEEIPAATTSEPKASTPESTESKTN